MRTEVRDAQRRKPPRVALAQLRPQVPPLESQLARRHGDARGACARAADPLRIEPVAAGASLDEHDAQVRVEARDGSRLLAEPVKLRVRPIAPCPAPEYRPRQEALPPQRDEPLRVEEAGMERPQAHGGGAYGARGRPLRAVPADTLEPRVSRKTIHDLLEESRRHLVRLTPAEAFRAARDGRVRLVDTRSDGDRLAQGVIPGARHHPLSTLEWELDPASGHADPSYDFDAWIVLICAEGYSSSLAAARLQALGFHRATDVIGGVDAWIAAGLPVEGVRLPAT